MLSELKGIRKTVGYVCAFEMNPLDSIDFLTVSDSLGYRASPDARLKFTKRHVHFASACGVGVKQKLNVDRNIATRGPLF